MTSDSETDDFDPKPAHSRGEVVVSACETIVRIRSLALRQRADLPERMVAHLLGMVLGSVRIVRDPESGRRLAEGHMLPELLSAKHGGSLELSDREVTAYAAGLANATLNCLDALGLPDVGTDDVASTILGEADGVVGSGPVVGLRSLPIDRPPHPAQRPDPADAGSLHRHLHGCAEYEDRARGNARRVRAAAEAGSACGGC